MGRRQRSVKTLDSEFPASRAIYRAVVWQEPDDVRGVSADWTAKHPQIRFMHADTPKWIQKKYNPLVYTLIKSVGMKVLGFIVIALGLGSTSWATTVSRTYSRSEIAIEQAVNRPIQSVHKGKYVYAGPPELLQIQYVTENCLAFCKSKGYESQSDCQSGPVESHCGLQAQRYDNPLTDPFIITQIDEKGHVIGQVTQKRGCGTRPDVEPIGRVTCTKRDQATKILDFITHPFGGSSSSSR